MPMSASPPPIETLVDKLASDLLHSRPIHTHEAPSPFSKESSEQNYRGFINLALLFLSANLCRLVMENFQKYGLLLTIPGKGVPLSDLTYFLLTFSLLVAHLTTVFLLEKLALLRPMSRFIGYLAALNISVLLLLPPWIIWTQMYHPYISGVVLMLDLIFTMKIISFHLVNSELRQKYFKQIDNPSDTSLNESKDPYSNCIYPNNLKVRNFIYFLLVPTLCYQPSYPRTARFRRTFFVKCCIEFASTMVMAWIAIEQFATPTVRNSMKHLDEFDVFGIIERVLKLSPTSLYVWLLGFYGIFHSFFNAVAEIMRFGDRQFYHAWWNANSMDEYWRLWNAPVHLWLKRHIYIPLRAKGYSSTKAQLAIFAISAFFHEYLVSVPTHSIQGWAFTAMLLQVPLIALSKQYLRVFPGSSVGNYVFWVTLCLFGQPMCVLLYYRAWSKRCL